MVGLGGGVVESTRDAYVSRLLLFPVGLARPKQWETQAQRGKTLSSRIQSVIFIPFLLITKPCMRMILSVPSPVPAPARCMYVCTSHSVRRRQRCARLSLPCVASFRVTHSRQFSPTCPHAISLRAPNSNFLGRGNPHAVIFRLFINPRTLHHTNAPLYRISRTATFSTT